MEESFKGVWRGKEGQRIEGHTWTVKRNKMNKLELANPYYSETFEDIE